MLWLELIVYVHDYTTLFSWEVSRRTEPSSVLFCSNLFNASGIYQVEARMDTL